jgi:oligopeptide transport system permease protein
MSIAARGDVLEEVAEVRGRSLWQDARRRLLRNRAAVVSMIVLAVIAGLALLAPWLSPHAYDEIYWERILAPPDLANAHWFGTAGNGRDLFVRTLYGARVSLTVGVLATAVSLLIGVAWGAIAGYFGGRVDNLMMRFVDIMYSLPFMFFVILLMVVFGRHIFLSFLGLGVQEPLTSWGVLIAEGAAQMESAPWLLIFPATFLAITLFCFNFIGDGLRDALDPTDR